MSRMCIVLKPITGEIVTTQKPQTKWMGFHQSRNNNGKWACVHLSSGRNAYSTWESRGNRALLLECKVNKLIFVIPPEMPLISFFLKAFMHGHLIFGRIWYFERALIEKPKKSSRHQASEYIVCLDLICIVWNSGRQTVTLIRACWLV